MKQLTCEMCGSADLIKQDGIFVCQSCGTKYSVEEARKMMVEGTVEIDDSPKIDNYYTMAESAFDAGNQREAEDYCNKILEINPNDYRTWLLKGRAAGRQSTLTNIRLKESIHCFDKAIENAPVDKAEEAKEAAASEMALLCLALISLCCENYAKSGSENQAKIIMDTVPTVKNFGLPFMEKCGVQTTNLRTTIAAKISDAAVAAYQNHIKIDYWGSTGHPSDIAWARYKKQTMDVIALIFLAIALGDGAANIARYEKIISIEKELLSSGSYEYSAYAGWVKSHILTDDAQQAGIQLMKLCYDKIKKIDPSYVVPELPQPTAKGGCYIATAVYGSYDRPQVWTLRRFRDEILAEVWYGRVFVRAYYAISPTLVKRFGRMRWFKWVCRNLLDRLVAYLNAKGIKDTPYQDRNW